MSKGDPERFLPPLPETRCATSGCTCQHYDEDRAAITDSERLVRIEDMLQQVLRKLRDRTAVIDVGGVDP
jgi:hypothetical protein